MNIVFVSNFLNHHQIPFCEKMIELCDNFNFIATQAGGRQGYQTTTDAPYVINYNSENKNKVENMIKSADAVIFGACPNELIDLRMRENKLSFLYSERFLKKGLWRRFIPTTRKKIKDRIVKFKNKNMYVLCASAYLSYELSLFNFPVEKCYKWGYFPECKNYDIDELISNKTQNSILWCARLIDWKHPEIPVLVAEKLKSLNVDFKLNIIGTGALEDEIKSMIKEKNLDDFIEVIGSMPPEEVRKNMEKSQIFLMTSDRQEGWGAVLNEAMNSACAVIANKAAGAVPYLIKNGENGFAYTKCDIDDICKKIVELFNDKEKMKSVQEQAYYTISNEWNSKVAAERLIKLSNAILNGEQSPDLFEDGICSKS